jgi:hypothetical protein
VLPFQHSLWVCQRTGFFDPDQAVVQELRDDVVGNGSFPLPVSSLVPFTRCAAMDSSISCPSVIFFGVHFRLAADARCLGRGIVEVVLDQALGMQIVVKSEAEPAPEGLKNNVRRAGCLMDLMCKNASHVGRPQAVLKTCGRVITTFTRSKLLCIGLLKTNCWLGMKDSNRRIRPRAR